MPKYKVEGNTLDAAGGAFCTSQASPAENKQAVERISKSVDRYFEACNVGIYNAKIEDMDEVIHSYVCQLAVIDVLIGRHFGISADAMLDYIPPAARVTAVALANEVRA